MKPNLWTGLMLALALSACGDEKTPGADNEEHAGEEHGDEHGDEHIDGGANHVTIEPAMAGKMGIKTAPVTARAIADRHEVQGLISPIEGRHAELSARFDGIVREVNASTGDSVAAGATLAQVESNTSLQRYAITAPFTGTVVARNATVGEVANAGDELFEVADLSKVWVDLHVFGADALHLGQGQAVRVEPLTGGDAAESVVERVLPSTATASQSTIARAVIENSAGRFRPGAAVRAWVTVGHSEPTPAVPLSAIQRMDGIDVAFVRKGDEYERRALRLGVRDAEYAAVVTGVAIGEEVVVEQSFAVRADFEKAGLEHEH